jgi:hypothetical protein
MGSLNVFSVLSVCVVGELQNVELLSDGSGVACPLARSLRTSELTHCGRLERVACVGDAGK